MLLHHLLHVLVAIDVLEGLVDQHLVLIQPRAQPGQVLGNAHRNTRLQTVLRQQRQHTMASQVLVADAFRLVHGLGHVELVGGVHRDVALVVVAQWLFAGTTQRLLRGLLGLRKDGGSVRIIVDAGVARHVADAGGQRFQLLDGHTQLTIVDEAGALVEVLVEQRYCSRIGG